MLAFSSTSQSSAPAIAELCGSWDSYLPLQRLFSATLLQPLPPTKHTDKLPLLLLPFLALLSPSSFFPWKIISNRKTYSQLLPTTPSAFYLQELILMSTSQASPWSLSLGSQSWAKWHWWLMLPSPLASLGSPMHSLLAVLMQSVTHSQERFEKGLLKQDCSLLHSLIWKINTNIKIKLKCQETKSPLNIQRPSEHREGAVDALSPLREWLSTSIPFHQLLVATAYTHRLMAKEMTVTLGH